MEALAGWENWYAHVGRDWDRIVVAGLADGPYASYNGQSVGAIARATGKDAWDVFFDLTLTDASAMPRGPVRPGVCGL